MWVFTPIGFFSVVAHRDKKKVVMVRARCREDLTAFRKKYCKKLGAIRFLDWSDYPYRAETSRWAFAHAMFKVSLDLTYTNFKSSVHQPGRSSLYMGVWSKLRDGERTGGFGKEIEKVRKKGTRYGSRDYGGHTYTPSVSMGSASQSNLFDDIHDGPVRGFRDDEPAPQQSYGWGNTRMYEDGDLTEEERRNCENPFFWQDESGNTSEDDEPLLDDDERQATLEFDSLDDVITHFKKDRD